MRAVTLDQDKCEAVNMADSVEMINDYNEARQVVEVEELDRNEET